MALATGRRQQHSLPNGLKGGMFNGVRQKDHGQVVRGRGQGLLLGCGFYRATLRQKPGFGFGSPGTGGGGPARDHGRGFRHR
ncbi:hypothetical protein DESC_40034 [Desulfosarcina cetonica]|nr:hypothetical protein DESC_40034 [Desulfosarcina cetonica]